MTHKCGYIITLVLSFALFNGVACDSDYPQIIWEGEHVRFASSDAEEPYGKTLSVLDDRIGQLIDRTGLTLNNPLTYYWLNEDDTKDFCDGHQACQQRHVVVSVDPIDNHEIAHVILESSFHTHRFLSEGFATYLGEMPISILDVTIDSIQSQFSPYIPPEAIDYRAAALFAGYIIEEYSKETFYQICRLVGPGADRRNFEAAFVHVLDITLDEFLTDLQAKIEATKHLCYAPKAQCRGTTYVVDENELNNFSIPVTESDEAVTGPYANRREKYLGIAQGVYQVEAVLSFGKSGIYSLLFAFEPSVVQGEHFAIISPCSTEDECNASGDVYIPFSDQNNDLLTGNNMQTGYSFFDQGTHKITLHLSNLRPEDTSINLEVIRIGDNY